MHTFYRHFQNEFCRKLLNTGKAHVDTLDKDGFSPLHRVCQEKPTTGQEEKEKKEGQSN